MSRVPIALHAETHLPGGQDPIPVSGGGGGGGGPQRVILDTPDATGNAIPGLTTSNGMTTIKRLIPILKHAGDGTWMGAVRIPDDYSSAGRVVIESYVNSTSGAVRLIVGSSVVATTGVSLDASWTDETAQNVTVPGTALRGMETSFTLTTTPAAGKILNVRVKRNAANAADTCTADLCIWYVYFIYTATT